MRIYLEDFHFTTIIGILDFERESPQEVIINLIVDYKYSKDEFINYVEIRDLIKNIMVEKKFGLIEDALENIINNISETFTNIEYLKLKISKPNILDDSKVSVEMESIFV